MQARQTPRQPHPHKQSRGTPAPPAPTWVWAAQVQAGGSRLDGRLHIPPPAVLAVVVLAAGRVHVCHREGLEANHTRLLQGQRWQRWQRWERWERWETVGVGVGGGGGGGSF